MVRIGFWEKASNQKKFLDEFAKKNGIVFPADWGKITVRQVKRNGGNSLMTFYEESLFHTLQSVYKGNNLAPC